MRNGTACAVPSFYEQPVFDASVKNAAITEDKGVSHLKDNIQDLPNEEWREIEGYGGKYLVSNMGRIKSLKKPTTRLLTAFVNNKGYPRVALCKDG